MIIMRKKIGLIATLALFTLVTTGCSNNESDTPASNSSQSSPSNSRREVHVIDGGSGNGQRQQVTTIEGGPGSSTIVEDETD